MNEKTFIINTESIINKMIPDRSQPNKKPGLQQLSAAIINNLKYLTLMSPSNIDYFWMGRK